MTEYRQVAPRRTLPGRADILATVTGVLARGGRRWAWQGPAGAADRWLAASGPKDLDIWYDPGPGDDPIRRIREEMTYAEVAAADDPRRVRHTTLAVETPSGPAVVDLTRGDLRVGPVLLVPAGEITTSAEDHRLTGAAAVADLLVRPVLRGRLPDAARLAEARRAWDETYPPARDRLRDRLESELGRAVADALTAVATGVRPDPALPRRARLRLAARSLTPANAAATWRQRRTVLPAGRAAGPLGLRTRGVLVALVGTDGAGKSTVADGLRARLDRFGLPTSTAYFGMARGNLPGVARARGILRSRDRPALRRAAAWLYAGEYVWRYLRTAAPPLARRQVVIVDRWIYDLRESPWPGSRAARVAEFLLPAPDVLVLPDAPIEQIHDRKPERPLADQQAQQERYRRLLAEHSARRATAEGLSRGGGAEGLSRGGGAEGLSRGGGAEGLSRGAGAERPARGAGAGRPARRAGIVVDTSGRAPDPLAALLAATVEAAHS
jgi:thymidylate kinase